MELRDGCWIVTVPGGEETNSCEAADEMPALDEVFEDPEAIEDFLVDVREAFDDYEDPGLRRPRGRRQLVLQPDGDGDRAAARRRAGAESRGDRRAAVELRRTSPKRSSRSRSRRSRRWTTRRRPTPRTRAGASSRRRRRRRASRSWSPTASSTSTDVPWYLRYPECGLAELGWNGEYYSLADAEFAATVEEASPCFQELVASGEADEADAADRGAASRSACSAATGTPRPTRTTCTSSRSAPSAERPTIWAGFVSGRDPSRNPDRSRPDVGVQPVRSAKAVSRVASSTAPRSVSMSPVSSTKTNAGWAGTLKRS